jgi:hypothetical protein
MGHHKQFGIKHSIVYMLIVMVLASLTVYLLIGRRTTDEPKVKRLTLSWNTNLNPVDEYQVFKGMTPDVNKMAKVQEIKPQSGNKQRVSWTFEDLDVVEGQQVCFRVRAFNSFGGSVFSDAVCTTP